MSRPQKPWLNWRPERESLSDLLSRRGGVIRVQTSPTGPLLEFANALRSELENGPSENPWTTIQFDSENSNTRYFGAMIRQIERSLHLQAEVASPISLGA